MINKFNINKKNATDILIMSGALLILFMASLVVANLTSDNNIKSAIEYEKSCIRLWGIDNYNMMCDEKQCVCKPLNCANILDKGGQANVLECMDELDL